MHCAGLRPLRSGCAPGSGRTGTPAGSAPVPARVRFPPARCRQQPVQPQVAPAAQPPHAAHAVPTQRPQPVPLRLGRQHLVLQQLQLRNPGTQVETLLRHGRAARRRLQAQVRQRPLERMLLPLLAAMPPPNSAGARGGAALQLEAEPGPLGGRGGFAGDAGWPPEAQTLRLTNETAEPTRFENWSRLCKPWRPTPPRCQGSSVRPTAPRLFLAAFCNDLWQSQ